LSHVRFDEVKIVFVHLIDSASWINTNGKLLLVSFYPDRASFILYLIGNTVLSLLLSGGGQRVQID